MDHPALDRELPNRDHVSGRDGGACRYSRYLPHGTGINPSGCGQPAAIVNVGPGPFGLALDPENDTLYVTNSGANTVSMLDTSSCNAIDPTGCSRPPLTAQVGNFPAFPAVDEATGTIYVPNITDGTVSVIDGATCNAATVTGCTRTATVTAGSQATEAAIDDRTHTVYINNFNDGTMSMIDITTCSARDMACDQAPTTVPVGPDPAAVVVDHASDTLYVQDGPTGDGSLGSVAMFDGRTCNATTEAGCTPRSTPDGSGEIWITENQATRAVYAVNEEDMNISMIDARTCNATDTAGCHPVPPALGIGGNTTVTPTLPDSGAGTVAVDASTDSLYATSQSENNVSILNGAGCNAAQTCGCSPCALTTTVGNGPQAIANDPVTHTAYAANQEENQADGTVSVINTRACNMDHLAGCSRSWPTVAVGTFP